MQCSVAVTLSSLIALSSKVTVMTIAEDNTLYATKSYWDQRYQQESDDSIVFDWFKSYSEIAPVLRQALPSNDAAIIMLGCGNSCMVEPR